MTPEEAARRARLAKILRLAELRDQAAEVDALGAREREARAKANIARYIAEQQAIRDAK